MNIKECSDQDFMLYMAYLIHELQRFKYKCYETFSIKEIIKIAPCNIDDSAILAEAAKRYGLSVKLKSYGELIDEIKKTLWGESKGE